MSKSNVEYLLSKLRNIHNELGGDQDITEQQLLGAPGAALSSKQKKDKFRILKLRADNSIMHVEKLLGERQQMQDNRYGEDSPQVIGLTYRIRGHINEVDRTIEKLEAQFYKDVNNPKSNPVENDNKRDVLERLKMKISLIKTAEDIGIPYEPNKVPQLKDLQAELEGAAPDHIKIELRYGDFDEEEKKAWGRWDEGDKVIDEHADAIAEGAIELKQRAAGIMDELDRQNPQIGKLSNKADELNKKIETNTRKAKDLLQKIRKSDNCCVTIVLLVVLIGLITVMYNMTQSS